MYFFVYLQILLLKKELAIIQTKKGGGFKMINLLSDCHSERSEESVVMHVNVYRSFALLPWMTLHMVDANFMFLEWAGCFY